MRNLEALIELAMRHVAQGRCIITRQQRLISEGRSIPGALDLLHIFERTQEIFEGDLDRLLKERAPRVSPDGTNVHFGT